MNQFYKIIKRLILAFSILAVFHSLGIAQYCTNPTSCNPPLNATATVTPASPVCPGTQMTLTGNFTEPTCDPNYSGLNPANGPYNNWVSVTHAMYPIPTINTGLTWDDEASVALPIGFTFNYACQSFTEFYATTNGIIQFSAPNGGYSTVPIPNAGGPNHWVGAWCDIVLAGGSIRYQTQGTAPCRRLVVQWINCGFFSPGGSDRLVNLQVILHESSNNMEVQIQDLQYTGSWLPCTQKVLGTENVGGTGGYAVAGRNCTVWNASREGWIIRPKVASYIYQWSNSVSGFISNSKNATHTYPNSNSIYTFEVYDVANGCTTKVDIPYTLGTVNMTAGSNSPVCEGQTLNLTSTPAGLNTYSWSGPNGFSSSIQNPTIANVTPAMAGTYTVIGSMGGNCTGSATVTVVVNPPQNVSITPPLSICRGRTATLTASGGVTYLWSGGENTPTINVTPAVTTSYTVTITAASGCSNTATTTVTVLIDAPITINPSPVTRCSLSPPTQLTASGGVTYSWSPAAGLSATNISNPTANPVATTTYTVTGTDAGGCTGTASVTVTVNPNPTITISPPAGVMCAIDPPFTFTASGGTSYVWSNGAVTPAISVNPGITTTYTVTGTDANGCTNTATAVLTVIPTPPVPTPLQVTSPVCPGQLAAIYSVINTPNTTYTWTVPAEATIVTGQGTSSLTVNWANNATPGNYVISVTATVQGCVSPALAMQVTVNPPPPAQPAAPTGPTPVCTGSSANYSTTPDPTASTYNWTGLPPGSFISNGIGTPNITINWGAAAPGVYTISVTASNSCGTSPSNSIIVTVITILPQPSLITVPNPLCAGQTATFSVINDPNATSYTWTNSCNGWTGTSTTNSIDYTPTAGGPCLITVTANNMCGSSVARSVVVNVGDVPATPSPVSGYTNVCVRSIQNYSVIRVPGVTYTWGPLPAGASYVNGQGTNAVRINWGTAAPGTYIVTVTPSNVCGDGPAGSFEVTIQDVPAAPTVLGPQNLCVRTSGVYSVTGIQGETYAWTVSPAGPSLSPAQNQVTVVFNQPGTFTLTATPSNRCGAGTPSSIVVTITNTNPAVVNPPIQTTCTPNYSLIGGTPTGGTYSCLWCPGGATVDGSGNVTGANIPGERYVFAYTVANAPCPTTVANVALINESAVGGTVGVPQTVCSGTSATVTLSGHSGSIVRWEKSTDCITFNPIQNQSVQLTYINLTQTTCFRAVVKRGSCPEVNSNSVAVTVIPRHTPVATPAVQQVCTNTGTVTATVPPLLSGTWIFASGPAVAQITNNNGVGSITGMTVPGDYFFTWTLLNPPCPAGAVTVKVTRISDLTDPNAGSSQIICSSSTTLVGNVPVVGRGSWSVVSGNPIPNVRNVGQNIGIVSGMDLPGIYVFRYTISNGVCPDKTADVTVEVREKTTQASAGVDQTVCLSTADVMGNVPPIVGVGSWSFQSGPVAATIMTSNNLGSITGMTRPGDYFFRYTITNAPCPPTFDDVKITVLQEPSQAMVAQTVYNTCQTMNAVLKAIRPQIGTGTWTFVSGPMTPNLVSSGTDGIVSNMTDPGTYRFRWTVSNPPCGTQSSVEVEVNREEPLNGNISAGPNQVLCNTTTTILTAATPVPARSSGVWRYRSGPVANVFVTTSGVTGTVINMDLPGVYVFEWAVKRLIGGCPEQTSAVTVEIKPNPTIANAGPDQSVCGSTASFTGNVPMVGIGSWSFVSGPITPSLITAGLPANQMNATNMTLPGTYCFRWTISNPPCVASTDDVCVTISPATVGGGVSMNATVCEGVNGGTLTLVGSVGSVIRWESSTNGFLTVTPIGVVTNTLSYSNLNQTTSYRAIVQSGNCVSMPSSEATITVNKQPTIANAGIDQSFCGGSSMITLIGNIPVAGTGIGTWTYQSGPPQPSMQLNGNILRLIGVNNPGTYVFRWTISNPPCADSFDEVNIIVSPGSVGGGVTSDATVCEGTNSGSVSLSGQTGNVVRWEYSTDMGSSWTVINNVTNIQNYTNLTRTTLYRAVVQSGVCSESFSLPVTITVKAASTAANAGPDQSFCGNVTNANLSGNVPVNGVGSWSFVSGPGNITPTISGSGNLATASGMTIDGVYTFRYTITNAPCAPSMDEMTVTRYLQSIPGTLSQSALVCSGNNSGTLSITNGNGPILRWEMSTDNFVNDIVPVMTNANTLAYMNLTVTTAYRVFVKAGACVEFPSNVVTITVQPVPSPADGGPNMVTACGSTVTLNAVQPLVGTGTWSVVTGPSPVQITQMNTMLMVTGMVSLGNYTFRWTVNGVPCPSTFEDILVARLPDAMVANAGTDITQCGPTAMLSGNDPAPNTSVWSFVGGPVTPNLSQSGKDLSVSMMTLPGTYIFRYTINQPPCAPSTDDVLINILPPPSPAIVQQQNITVCDINTATLFANPVQNGTGVWSFVSGPSQASITGSPIGLVNGMTLNGAYIFRWTVTAPPCSQVNTVDVVVNRQSGVSVQAFAGSNQRVCDNPFALVVGNQPPPGSTGTWSFLSGPAIASITTVGNFGSITNMTLPGDYRFAWSIDPGNGCPASTSVVMITRVEPPTPAIAGPIQSICGNSVVLTGNVPMSGTGSWSFIAGPILPNMSPQGATLTVSNMNLNGVYHFRWTISNAPCTPSAFDVPITVNGGSVSGIVSGSVTVCSGNNSGTMNLSGQKGTIVRWESSTDNFMTFATIPNNSITQPYNNLTQTTCYRAVIKDGSCPEATTNIVCVTVNPSAPVANGGADQTICGGNTILTGNMAQGGQMMWSFISGPSIPVISQSQNSAVVSGMTQPGIYMFRYQIDYSPCGSADDLVMVTVSLGSSGGTVSPNRTVCGATNSGSMVLTGQVGSVVRWEMSEDNQLWSPIVNSTPIQTYSNLTRTTYYRAIVRDGIVCNEAISNSATVTVRQSTIANAGMNQTICNSTSATLTGNIPVDGTGSWSFVSGPVVPNLTPNGNMANVTGMTLMGNYVFRYTITNAPCATNSADVTLQVTPVVVGGTASSPMTVCEGTNTGTLILSGFGGNVLRWESSSDNFATNTIIHLNPTNQHTFFNLLSTTWYRAVVGGPGCQEVISNSVKITVIPTTVPANAGSNQTVCTSTTTLTGNNPGNGTGVWSFVMGPSNAQIVQSGVDGFVSGMILPGNYVFKYTITNMPCASSASNVQVTVIGNGNVGTVGGAATVCEGQNAGSVFVSNYSGVVVRWESSLDNQTWNPINNSGNQESYLNLTQTTYYRAITQLQPCGPSATNSVKITVLPLSGGGLVSGSTTVCATGNSGSMTLSGHSGNIVRWESSVDGGNSWIVLGNVTTLQTYINLTQTTVFRAVTSNQCGTSVSGTATVTVSNAAAGGSITGGGNYCITNNSGVLNLVNFVGNVVRWESSVDNQLFTPIVNNTPVQNFANLTQTTYYRAVVSSGACGQATSGSVAVSIIPESVGGILSGNATVCSGNNSGMINLSGQVGNIQRWEFSTDGGVTWTNIANNTPNYTYNNLAVNTQFRVLTQSGNCSGAYSNPVTIAMNPNSDGGSVMGSATVCSGQNSGMLTLVNYTGTILRWESSMDNLNYQPIFNQSPNLPYVNLNQTMYYRAVVSSMGCGGQAYSSVGVVTVSPPSNAGVVSGGGIFCGVANTVLNLTNYVGNIVRWESSTDGFNYSPINDQTPNLAISVNQRTFYRVVVQSGSCPAMTGNVVTVEVTNPSVGGNITGGSSVCGGNNSGVLNLVNQVGSVVRWEYSTDNGNTWTTINNQSSFQTYNGLNSSRWYRAFVQNGNCAGSYSDIAQVTIGSNIQLTANAISGCTGNASVNAVATGGQGVITYSISPNILPSNNTGQFGEVPFGTYTITATDAAGCSKSVVVVVGNTPTAPIINNVANITQNSAFVTWPAVPPGNGVIYTIRYRVLGSQTWTYINNIMNTFITLTGLQNNTTYEVGLAYRCSSNGPQSPFSTGVVDRFTTLSSGTCSDQVVPVPGGIYLDQVTPTTMMGHWNIVQGAAGYIVRYGRMSQQQNTWLQDVVCNPTNFYLMANLSPNTEYGFQIRTNCTNCTTALNNNDRRSVWSSVYRVTTPLNRGEEITHVGVRDLVVYPNPNRGNFEINLSMIESGEAEVQMIDITGREILSRKVLVNTGENTIPVDISGWSSGVYMLRVNIGSETRTVKVIGE